MSHFYKQPPQVAPGRLDVVEVVGVAILDFADNYLLVETTGTAQC